PPRGGNTTMASKSPRLLAAVFAVALLAPAGVARAESLADRETARKQMEVGHDRFDAGDFKAALEAFKIADDIVHAPTTGLFVARAQEKLGLLIEARATLQAVKRIPPAKTDPPPFAKARKDAEALDDDLDQRIPQITFALSG